MIIIGCDFHPSWQQIAWVDTETGETGERKLMHATGEAERFYRQLPAPARVGLEATGNSHWFVDLLGRPESSSSTSLANIAMLTHRQGQFFLDRAFALIEGHPRHYAHNIGSE